MSPGSGGPCWSAAPRPRARLGQASPRPPRPWRRAGDSVYRALQGLVDSGRLTSSARERRGAVPPAIPCTITIWLPAMRSGRRDRHLRGGPVGVPVAHRHGFTITGHQADVFGVCAACHGRAPETTTPAPQRGRRDRRSGRSALLLARALARRRGPPARVAETGLAAALLERLAEALELQVTVVLGRDVGAAGSTRRGDGWTAGRLRLGNLGLSMSETYMVIVLVPMCGLLSRPISAFWYPHRADFSKR